MEIQNWSALQSMIPECNSLDSLFELWQAAHAAEEAYQETTPLINDEYVERTSFVKDGCFSEKEFKGILFILKESNISDDRNQNKPEMRNQFDWYNKCIASGKDKGPKQIEKMCRMASYIIHGKSNIELSKKEFLNSEIANGIAFMNLNKRGGDGHCIECKLESYILKYSAYIKKQIDILKPKVIICLGTYNNVYKHIFANDSAGKDMLVNMWHPAYCMKGVVRPTICNIEDKNVYIYIREFENRYNEWINSL